MRMRTRHTELAYQQSLRGAGYMTIANVNKSTDKVHVRTEKWSMASEDSEMGQYAQMVTHA